MGDNMKKLFIYAFAFLSVLVIDARARGFEHNMIFDDVTTFNFKEKLNNIDYDKITKICSYDFCDYLKGRNIDDSLDIFTHRYLNTIQDLETKNTLKVKGVKITKITVDN